MQQYVLVSQLVLYYNNMISNHPLHLMQQLQNNFKIHLHHLPTLNNNPPPPRSFHATKYTVLLKKKLASETLIEQIIECESRVAGSLVVHIFLKLVIFMTKQKSPAQGYYVPCFP